MSTEQPPITITNEAGKLRVVLPATTLQADDVAGLLNHFAALVETIKSSLQEAAEDRALRELEKNAPRRAALERLAARYPPAHEWFEDTG